MKDFLLIGIVSILIAGIGAQWLAWRFKWPSIVLLLGLGFIGGPVTHLINPDEVLGPLLLPLVSVCVAIILFEGGMGLRIFELKKIGAVVFSLVSLGAFVNWILITLSARFILGFDFPVAFLVGAILVVTGPTVIIPLLRHVRPAGKVGSILKWEGIVIDPIGAALAVLVFEYIIIGESLNIDALVFFIKSILVGTLAGGAGAWFLLLLLRKYWIPDFLHGTVTLMLVVTVFILSNIFHHESGLFAVIAMGVVLGNQRKVEVQHIVSFKENLGILIISTLFIILSARLDLNDLRVLNWNFLLFMMVLIFIARPLSVFISTLGSGLKLNEKLFISWMAPRGIVAAAIVSIFAFELSLKGVNQADRLVPVIFLVIVATVIIYGLTSLLVAQKLGLARRNPQGILILGAHDWARMIAKKLQEAGIKVILIDTNALNVSLAHQEDLQAYEENILNQDIEENIDLDGIGRLITLSGNDEANSLAVLHFRDIFGRSEVYQLNPGRKNQAHTPVIPPSLRGRYLFSLKTNYDQLSEAFETPDALQLLTAEEDMNDDAFTAKFGNNSIALFSINEKNDLKIHSTDEKLNIKKGHKLVLLLA